ncbi:MAG: ADP-glyceromanno-heptose 6-epimerase [Bacteriovoracales bacterium]|nr:ADP-glyceromanno-heptose 6-epimerase [Bacteriovoracales bacterium]
MILVTGGAGFIGSVLVKALNDLGIDRIVVVDRMGRDGKWRNLSGLRYADFIHADDLWNPEHETLLNRIQEIYHLGACSSTVEQDMDYLMKNNWEYSKKLFALAVQSSCKFCYASSAATYGRGERGHEDKESDVYNLRPLNAYGYSKQYFDEWVLMQKKLPKSWYGIKFFNVFGPNEYHKGSMSSVVFHAFHQIKKEGAVKLFKSYRKGVEDGEQKRDFVYVKDVARAVIALMGSGPDEGSPSGLYNMGTGKARSFLDLAHATFSSLGLSPNITFIPMPDDVREQYQYYTQADMTKFSNAVRDFEFTSLEEGIDDYVKSYLDTQDPYVAKPRA